ncbi:hypothetical protein HVA01_13710 [Halovibrio variabilis]|uniref:DUF4426 domain-containing protein n=1 Tax=Halovibrio variabilis TaxID=31910 RepID=A0A511UM74_9GAMM|nr:DUF4426 domain-containing protein [Halovibrio variabilis]GEN27725.1 hypothetical protein HVA01_13710 [Halovibrio variabilis]
MLRRLMISAALVGTLLASAAANAEQFDRVGDYEIHYSAVNSSFLTPEVAQANNLQRSANRGLVNVSVRERQEDGSTRPVNASVQGHVSGLTGAQESLSFRTVHDGDATYHLAPFTLRDDEAMRFELSVRYDRNAAPEPVNFIQRFYIDR